METLVISYIILHCFVV